VVNFNKGLTAYMAVDARVTLSIIKSASLFWPPTNCCFASRQQTRLLVNNA